MQETILIFMGKYGSLAVFLLILAENLFPPIPSEVILTFGGVMTTCTQMHAAEVILAATAGSVAGACILYFAGRLIPEERIRQILQGKPGIILHMDAEEIDIAKVWFARKGSGAVFFCRLIPVLRSLISVPAGMAGMSFVPFMILSTSGSLIWNTILVLAGKAAGDSWEKVSEIFGIYSNLLLMIAGSALLLFAMMRQVRQNENGDKNNEKIE